MGNTSLLWLFKSITLVNRGTDNLIYTHWSLKHDSASEQICKILCADFACALRAKLHKSQQNVRTCGALDTGSCTSSETNQHLFYMQIQMRLCRFARPPLWATANHTLLLLLLCAKGIVLCFCRSMFQLVIFSTHVNVSKPRKTTKHQQCLSESIMQSFPACPACLWLSAVSSFIPSEDKKGVTNVNSSLKLRLRNLLRIARARDWSTFGALMLMYHWEMGVVLIKSTLFVKK